VPFTASHPAAVLPLLRRGQWVSAALVTGSMAPDLPSYLPLHLEHDQTHPLHAILWPDLLLAVGLLLTWWFLARPGLTPLWPRAAARLGPPGWRDPAVRAGGSARWAWLGWVLLSLLVGLATHLLWDAFTHSDGLVVEHWSALAGTFAGHHVFDWLLGLSSVVGLSIVLGYVVHAWRQPAASSRPDDRPVDDPEQGDRVGRPLRRAVLAATVALTAVSGWLEWRSLTAIHAGHLLLWSETIKVAGGAVLVCLGGWSLAWALLRSTRSARLRAAKAHRSGSVRVP
jgi:uncharacterized membrane protein